MNDATGACGTSRAWVWELAAACVSLVAIVARLIPWKQIFTGDGLVLPGPDPYYHLWRAEMLVRHFPAFQTFDPYISFPLGAHIPWPPGFDLLVALPGLMTGDPAVVAPWGAVLMPLLGGLTTYLLYRLGRRVFDPATGLVAAGFFALMGGAIGFSFVGRIDHHALVAPVTLGVYLSMLAAIAAASRARAVAWSIGCGLLAAVSVGCWIITPALYFLPVPVTLALLRSGPYRDSARRVAWYGLLTAFSLVLIVVLLIADLKSLPFTLYQPSWFTVLLFGLAALWAISFMYGPRVFLPAWAALAACVAVAALSGGVVFKPILAALKIAAGADVVYQSVSESAKIFMNGDVFDLNRLIYGYSNLILLAPLMIAVYLWSTFRTRNPRPGLVFTAVFWPFAIVLLVIQERFGEFSASAVALLFACFLVAGVRKFIVFCRTTSSRARSILWAGLGTIGLALALGPLVTSLVSLSSNWLKDYRRMSLFGRELAEQLPVIETDDGRLSYGLLTSWEMSHLLLYTARVPVMVSSFGTHEATLQNQKGFRILLASNEESAYRKLAANHIRFIVTVPLVEELNAMAAMAGLDEKFVQTSMAAGPNGFLHYLVPLRPYAECLYIRLLLSDGTIRTVAGNVQKPLAHFRLFFESRSHVTLFHESIPAQKAFEVVPGAHLVGSAAPGQEVLLRLTVESNAGRHFVYSRKTHADADGKYEFVVPYPTEDWGAPTRILSPYRLKAGDVVIRVLVGERDVRLGRTVVVPRFAADQTTPGGKESPPVSEQR